MNILAAFTVRQINEGKAIDLEQLDWQIITDNWRCGTLVDIIYELNKVEDVERVRDCILSLVRKSQIKPSEVFVNEFVSRCNFHIAVMKQSTAMAGRTDQPPAEPTEPTETVELANNTFSIPRYLQADRAENMLKALEDVTGYDNKPVLDRSKTPWGYSSQPDWGHAAKKIVEKLGITMRWEDWGNLIGTDGKKLQKAYNNSSQSSDSKNRITNAIKSIK